MSHQSRAPSDGASFCSCVKRHRGAMAERPREHTIRQSCIAQGLAKRIIINGKPFCRSSIPATTHVVRIWAGGHQECSKVVDDERIDAFEGHGPCAWNIAPFETAAATSH